MHATHSPMCVKRKIQGTRTHGTPWVTLIASCGYGGQWHIGRMDAVWRWSPNTMQTPFFPRCFWNVIRGSNKPRHSNQIKDIKALELPVMTASLRYSEKYTFTLLPEGLWFEIDDSDSQFPMLKNLSMLHIWDRPIKITDCATAFLGILSGNRILLPYKLQRLVVDQTSTRTASR